MELCFFFCSSVFFFFFFILLASSIHRQSREIDNERLNNPTASTKHLPSNISSNKLDHMNSVNSSFPNIISNESSGHISNSGYNHDDDNNKFTISSDAHSLPIVAPAEPKSKSKFFFFFFVFLNYA